MGNLSIDRAGGLLAALAAVPDPRRTGGRRHPGGYVLGVLVAAFSCAGFASFAAAAQWAAGADRGLLLVLGAAPDPLSGAVAAPSAPTLRRMATGVDVAALEAVIAAWTADALGPADPAAGHRDDRRGDRRDDRRGGWRAAAGGGGGGKTMRGARTGDTLGPHLLAAATRRTEERILSVVDAAGSDENSDGGIDFPGAAPVFRVIRHTGGLDRQRTRKELHFGRVPHHAHRTGATSFGRPDRGVLGL